MNHCLLTLSTAFSSRRANTGIYRDLCTAMLTAMRSPWEPQRRGGPRTMARLFTSAGSTVCDAMRGAVRSPYGPQHRGGPRTIARLFTSAGSTVCAAMPGANRSPYMSRRGGAGRAPWPSSSQGRV